MRQQIALRLGHVLSHPAHSSLWGLKKGDWTFCFTNSCKYEPFLSPYFSFVFFSHRCALKVELQKSSFQCRLKSAGKSTLTFFRLRAMTRTSSRVLLWDLSQVKFRFNRLIEEWLSQAYNCNNPINMHLTKF